MRQALNFEGTHFLFRDKHQILYLSSLTHATKFKKADQEFAKNSVVLTEDCQFAQWIHETDVVVAQTKDQLIVWYDIHHLETKQIVNDLKDSQVEAIQRSDLKCVF